MSLISVISFAAFAIFAIWAIADMRRVPVSPSRALENAIKIAWQRVDRGEIDRNDFERIVSILKS